MSTPDTPPQPTPALDARSQADIARELIKSEYDRIKSEQAQRIGFRDNMLFVHLASVGAVASWTLANLNPTPPATPSPYTEFALLVIPWIGIVLGWTYVVNDNLISRIGKYVTKVMTPRVRHLAALPVVPITEDGVKSYSIGSFFGWEPFHKQDKRRKGRKRLQFAVDELTFVVPGILAILGFLHLTHWPPGWIPGQWRLGDWVVAVTLVIEVLSLGVLAVSIYVYADFKRAEEEADPNTPL